MCDDPAIADRFIDKLEEASLMLASNRRVGRRRPELHPSIRSFAVGNYVIFYRLVQRGIEIARVLHGHRDIRRLR